jgi:hypothetical protein
LCGRPGTQGGPEMTLGSTGGGGLACGVFGVLMDRVWSSRG